MFAVLRPYDIAITKLCFRASQYKTKAKKTVTNLMQRFYLNISKFLFSLLFSPTIFQRSGSIKNQLVTC